MSDIFDLKGNWNKYLENLESNNVNTSGYNLVKFEVEDEEGYPRFFYYIECNDSYRESFHCNKIQMSNNLLYAIEHNLDLLEI